MAGTIVVWDAKAVCHIRSSQRVLAVTSRTCAFHFVNARFKLITLDPGHYHASLVQKFMYADVDPVVHVYAPGGDDLQEHCKRIERFNSRFNLPTSWRTEIYAANDFLQKMVHGNGNVVVIAGNNLHDNGLHFVRQFLRNCNRRLSSQRPITSASMTS